MVVTGQAAPRRAPLVVGAWLTVVAAVAFDLGAGEAPLHAATLGVVAALTAAVRIRMAGRHRSLAQFVSGCVVSQPAMHYGIHYLPHPDLEHGVGLVPGAADLLTVCTQIMLVLALAAGVSIVEQVVVALAAGTVGLGLALVRVGPVRVASPRRVIVRRRAPRLTLKTSRYVAGSIARRGPPARAAALSS